MYVRETLHILPDDNEYYREGMEIKNLTNR